MLAQVHTPKSTVDNPYKLKMVPFKDIDKDYYTMSANGVTHIRADGYSGMTCDHLFSLLAHFSNVFMQTSPR